MPWARIDDMLPVHPKIRSLSDSAFRLFISAICWSSLNRTDGHIPSAQLRYISDVRRPHQAVDQLLQAGLWETAAGGWLIHDYLDYQPSAAKVHREREAKRDRQERWRSNGDASHDAPQDASLAHARLPSHPIPISGPVVIQPAGPSGPVSDLISTVQKAIYDRTNRKVSDETALAIAAQITASENVRNPIAYVNAAILRDPNPRRFLPVSQPPPVHEAIARALNPNGRHAKEHP